MLTLGLSLGHAQAQDSGSLTLNLVTCTMPGSVTAITIDEVFDRTNCDETLDYWEEEPNFQLNGVPSDSGDNSTLVVFTGLVPGERYSMSEANLVGWFDFGFSFTAVDHDLEFYAILDKVYIPETDSGDDDGDSGTVDEGEVTGLPNTGFGPVHGETSSLFGPAHSGNDRRSNRHPLAFWASRPYAALRWHRGHRFALPDLEDFLTTTAFRTTPTAARVCGSAAGRLRLS
jgi:hypothetical protein